MEATDKVIVNSCGKFYVLTGEQWETARKLYDAAGIGYSVSIGNTLQQPAKLCKVCQKPHNHHNRYCSRECCLRDK